MKKGPPMVLAVSLALVADLVLASTVALADGFHGGSVPGGPVIGGPVVARPFAMRRFVHHQSFRRPFFHRHPFTSTFGVIASRSSVRRAPLARTTPGPLLFPYRSPWLERMVLAKFSN